MKLPEASLSLDLEKRFQPEIGGQEVPRCDEVETPKCLVCNNLHESSYGLPPTPSNSLPLRMTLRQTRRFSGLFAAATALLGLALVSITGNPAALLTSAFVPATTATEAAVVLPATLAIDRLPAPSPAVIDSETLWLARCIYSETKRPDEQELVAWVLRNRVETGYRGNSTYETVVLDPYQFSAFIRGTSTYTRYTALDASSDNAGFQKALAIAHFVRNAPAAMRPFEGTTRHFYSEQSMAGGRAPAWAVGKDAVAPTREFSLEARRFRFYAGLV